MSSVRGIKKVLKNSKGFCIIIVKNDICACISEWDTTNIPYKLIKRIEL